MTNKTFMVARWEYIEKVKSKAFLFSLIFTPLVMVVFSVIPSLLAMKEDTSSRSIGIIDQSGQVTGDLKPRLENHFKLKNGLPNYVLVPVEFSGDLATSKKRADQLILKGEIEGCLIIGSTYMTDTLFEYRSQNVANEKLMERVSRILRTVVIEKKLIDAKLDPALFSKFDIPIDLKGIKISKGGKEEETGFGQVILTSYGFMMMMFILVLTSGQLLVRSMLEEKSNRVVEVLLSSCSSTNLMSGKILGLSLLGLTQMAFWGILAAGLTLKFGALPITMTQTMLMLVYFILGYLFYAALFVALGSPISTEQEAQYITSYISMIPLMPLMFAFLTLQDPNSILSKVLSFFPLTAPTMMAFRIPVQMPEAWELVTSAVLLLLSAIAMMWIAGKIFRTTILLTGKRPGLAELYQIVRTK